VPGNVSSTAFGVVHLGRYDATEIARAASDHVQIDRLGINPITDQTEAGATTSVYLTALAASGIRAEPCFNWYAGTMSNIDPTTWANAVVAWFRKYGRGGTFWSAATNPLLGVDVAELFNEPHGGGRWTPPDPSAYFVLVRATREALDAAGLTWVKTVSAGDVARAPTFYNAFKSYGGLDYVSGVAPHPYGPVEAVGYTSGWAGTHRQSFESQIAATESWAPGKMLHITEVGQNTGPSTGDSLTVSQDYQAQAVTAYVQKANSDPNIAALHIYQWAADGYGIEGTPAETAFKNAVP
jgi:hypothetical protein